MTPSERLVAAADLIRDLAAKAVRPPWVHALGEVDHPLRGKRELVADCADTGTGEWIAALSPALAPLLINWLETEAACIASVEDVKRIMPKILDNIESGVGGEDTTVTVTIDTSGAALAFAQAILGSGVDTP